jgi:hypothetical protein
MKSIYWIDRAKEATGIESDYKMAQMLGMSRSAISHHRGGNSTTLDDKAAYKIEEMLKLPHGKVVLDQHAEREKDPAMRSMWQKLAAVACQILAIAVLTVGMEPKPAEAREFFSSNDLPFYTLCAVIGQAWRRLLATLRKVSIWSCSPWNSKSFSFAPV